MAPKEVSIQLQELLVSPQLLGIEGLMLFPQSCHENLFFHLSEC